VTLRTRLVLAAAYILIVVVAVLEIPLGVTIARRERTEFENGLLLNATLLASRINDDVPAQSDPGQPARQVPAIDAAARESANALRDASASDARIVVVDGLGRVLADTSGEAALGEEYATDQRPEFGVALGGRIDRRVRFSDTLGRDLLIVTAPVIHQQSPIGAVRTTASLSEVNARVMRTWIGLALIGVGVIAVGLALAWTLATSLVRPVQRLEGAAERLGSGDLESRAIPEGPEEVATLARSFNRMAGTLSSNIRAQRDFLANASHQLRTPLTGLKLRLEAIEQDGGFAGDQAKKAEAEVDRLSALVDDLLELARASSVEGTAERVDLSELARSAVDRWAGPAESAGKRIVDRTDGPCPVLASAHDLAQVLDNLIENSIRYTPEGTEITVETRRNGDGWTFAVADDGPGIAVAERERIFERFYRGSTGKQAGPGTGLGLAVVAELVRRWDGDVRLFPSANGTGTRFEATFPAAPADP
jgi:signal transduction histidine kinase